jgi:site-specific recombinase XerD
MRSCPDFKSALSGMMERFVLHKRMLGFDYTCSAKLLLCFDRFLCGVDCSGGSLRGEHFSGYLETLSHLKPKSRQCMLAVVRQFSIHLNAFRPDSPVMPLRLMPAAARGIRFFRIAPGEVFDLMCAARTLGPKGGIRPQCIRFLIGLLYTTGLRISEALNLELGDVGPRRNTLFVHCGKFGKDRIVALERTTAKALGEWLELRQGHAGTGNSAPLLAYAPNEKLSYRQAWDAFRRLCRQCNLQGDPPPRLHDLRHNYACECLNKWRSEGKDVQALLPILSAAMGHVNPVSTQCYIHAGAATLRHAAGKMHDLYIQRTEQSQ